ncbi:MAG TPA: prepilin-type N-terminal cleavage/methylation domain-containing protein [Rhabdochlamydiaceae bacterium]
MKKRKKQPFTLMEIMIVIFLIGLIGGVISYNMKGSMDEGRVFKTERGIEQIGDTLRLAIARGATLKEIQEDPKFYINQAGIVKDADKLLKDGWGQPYEIVQDETRSDIVVRSAKLTEYLQSKGRDKK